MKLFSYITISLLTIFFLGTPALAQAPSTGAQLSGTILDPTTGNEWSALMRLSPDGQDLTVRCFLGMAFLGKDQYWKRLADACYAQLDPTIVAKFKMAPAKPGAPLPKGKPPAGC